MAIKGFEKKDPMAGLNQLMQMMNQMNQMQDRDKSQINSSLSSILEASKYATNEQTMSNVMKQYDSMSSDSSKYQETDTQYNLIGDILKDRNAQINQYTRSVQDAESIINDAGFLDKESEFVDLHSNVMSMKNDDDSQKYESVMEWVSNEYARIESISNTLASGQKLGLRRGQGIDDSNIIKDIDKYKNRLNVALEALIGDNTITPEEANLIIMGDRDTFKTTRNRKINEAEYGIKNYDALIEIIDKQAQGLSSGKGTDANFTKILSEVGIEGDEANQISQYINDEGILGMNESELTSAKEMYILERNRMIDSYKSWSGSDFIGAFKTADEIGADELGKFALDENFIEGEGFTEADTSLADPSMRTGITVEKSKEIEKELNRKEINKKVSEEFSEKLHPEVMDEAKHWFPDGNYNKIGVIWTGEDKERMWAADIKNKLLADSNLLKERDKILDGSDKASFAMNEFLENRLNMNQAMTKGKYSDSDKTELIGKFSRRKLKKFQDKFKNSNLTIEEFIAQNKEEYYEMTKILKYGDYWFKKPRRRMEKSKHYINLYD